MGVLQLKAGEGYGTTLPSPVSVSSTDELIWSSNTGRSTASGLMIGDVVAQKETVTIEWGVTTWAQYQTIKNALGNGFFPFRVVYPNGSMETITGYRSTIQKGPILATGDGVTYFQSIQVQVIQQ